MKLNIIDVATSTMRSVNKCLGTMSQLEIKEMPQVVQKSITEFVADAPIDTFTSVLEFGLPGEGQSKGGMVIYIAPENIKALFSELYGLDSASTNKEIADMCGEFINVIIGRFKTELTSIGYGEISIGIPKNSFGAAKQKVKVDVKTKYEITFTKHKRPFLVVDVALETSEMI